MQTTFRNPVLNANPRNPVLKSDLRLANRLGRLESPLAEVGAGVSILRANGSSPDRQASALPSDLGEPLTLRVLIIEDVPRDADLMLRELRRAGIGGPARVVDTAEAMLRELAAFAPDLVLSDYALPHFSGLLALEIRNQRAPELPLIIVTASNNEEIAVDCLRRGADDYVLKDHLIGLPSAVRRALEQHRLERAKRQAEERLQAREAELSAIFAGAAEGILVVDLPARAFRYANPAACRLLGYAAEELLALTLDETHPAACLPQVLAAFQPQPDGQLERAADLRIVRKDGAAIWVDVHTAVTELDGRPCLVSFLTDVTEQKQLRADKEQLEAQLRQTQKLEAVGRLAGGVAHDFNNMLGVILGYGEMVLDKVRADESLCGDVQEIMTAAEHSRDVTRQLLAFARKQVISPVVLDLNATVDGMLQMLRRLVGKDIELVWQPAAGLWPIRMDPTQVDQILANLCLNARDAIADAGRICLRTENAAIDAAYCATHAEAAPGEYTVLTISDDGCGMTREVLEKIFEPFFTTKGLGQGTGLGLATVYGVVKQNRGFVEVASEPGRGATFKIYLPRHPSSPVATASVVAGESPRGRGATILLVEDEPSIRKLLEMALGRLGYHVLSAQTPGEALRLAELHGDEIRLLLTDVVMPEMNGRALAQQLGTRHPHLKQLFMSGYNADVVAERGILEPGVQLIHKPFSLLELGTCVKAVLEA